MQAHTESSEATDKKLLAESASVKSTVNEEVAKIKRAAAEAEKKIQLQERAEVKAITTSEIKALKSEGQLATQSQKPARSAAPASTTLKAALPAQQHAASAPKSSASQAPAAPAQQAAKAGAGTASRKHAAVKAQEEEDKAQSHDHAARPPRVVDMKDGDEKPRGESQREVVKGYWAQVQKQQQAHKVQESGGKSPKVVVAAGTGPNATNKLSQMPAQSNKSVKQAQSNKLSQMPAATSSGGYSKRRAQGRAAMRTQGAVVAPGFGDRKVSLSKATEQAPFAQFAGQVWPGCRVQGCKA